MTHDELREAVARAICERLFGPYERNGSPSSISEQSDLSAAAALAAIREAGFAIMPPMRFQIGQRVRKIKGSSWQGRVRGFYGTELTPEGYAVESEHEPGSVQVYPASALEAVPEIEVEQEEVSKDIDARLVEKQIHNAIDGLNTIVLEFDHVFTEEDYRLLDDVIAKSKGLLAMSLLRNSPPRPARKEEKP